MAISLLLNAKKSISSHQLARDLNMNQKTAWFLAMRVRAAMVEDDSLLIGIVEADETYIRANHDATARMMTTSQSVGV